jgi:hypothetical protein
MDGQVHRDAFAVAVDRPEEAVAHLLEFYAVPLVLTSDDGPRVFADEHGVLAFIQEFVDGLLAQSYSRTDLISEHVLQINHSTAIYSGQFSRKRVDGSEISRVGGTYFVASGPLGSRIFAVAASGASSMLPPGRGK